ncbi:hypothetical protein Bca52824_096459 [Brassica carinata]|uniref:Pentatricopeptide repeat-containing protein n=1 Tax=Brassica carinata TaxID=52824 RepID=A0A8X7TH44_BRACI|nr:hypothetical protein Bca52824_096459 [Brassica carinata]
MAYQEKVFNIILVEFCFFSYGEIEKCIQKIAIKKLKKRKERRKPNVVTYNALIDAYGSNGLLAEAVGIFRQMEQDGFKPNVVSVCTLLAACSSYLKDMEDLGVPMTKEVYSSVLCAYSKQASVYVR